MHQHGPALADLLGGHQRRPIDKPRPGLVRQFNVGFGQHLPRYRHVGRQRQPGKRALRRERSEPGRLIPGQRAAHRAAAPAQPHRQQLVAVLGQMGAGKSQQHAAFLDPVADRGLLARRIRAGIGIDQHGQLALQQVGREAAAEFGERGERTLDIVVLAEQRLAARARGDGDADRTAAPEFVDQHHSPGRLLALDLDPDNPVAQLGRHRQAQRGPALARSDRRGFAPEQRPVRGAGPHRHRARQRGRQRLHDDAEFLRALLAGDRFGQQQARRIDLVGRDIAQRAAPVEERRESGGGLLGFPSSGCALSVCPLSI